MKKLFTSKSFLAGTLGILCVAILAVCLLWDGSRAVEFIPDEPVPLGIPIDSWTENAADFARTPVGAGFSPAGQPAGKQQPDAAAEFPKVMEVTADEVVINFTDPNPVKPLPPVEPGTNPDNNPTLTQDTAPGSQPATSQPANPSTGTTAPGSTNGRGEFYDPVFGWIRPGNTVQTEIDSPGDINKMVGNMGG
jgi:hypothetical protein